MAFYNLNSVSGFSRPHHLVPEVIEDFFIEASPISHLRTKAVRKESHIYRVGKVPRALWSIGERLEPRFGQLGREYGQVVFDKEYLEKDPTLEWVTPGHPLFEALRDDVSTKTESDMRGGAVFFDIHREVAARLDVFTGAIRDGRGNVVHRRLFLIETSMDGDLTVRQPTLFLDLVPASQKIDLPDDTALPSDEQVKRALIEHALNPLLVEVATERIHETETIQRHLEVSLNELINREQLRFADFHTRVADGEFNLRPAVKRSEEKLEELNHRKESRLSELEKEHHCSIADIRHHGRAWVLPHPERRSSGIAPMVRNDEIERIAVEAVTQYEEARDHVVESVEAENRGFDLISRESHQEDAATAIKVRFIEVKGRASVGEVALSSNEYKTAARLKEDYWLYVVYNCATKPEIHIVQDPVRLGWKAIMAVEHYRVGAKQILAGETKNQETEHIE